MLLHVSVMHTRHCVSPMPSRRRSPDRSLNSSLNHTRPADATNAAFEAKISNTKSPTGDLCGIWTSDCTGDSQAALGSCGLDTGASLFYAYRCHNRAKCSDCT